MYRIYFQHLFFLGLALLSAVWNSVGNVETLRTPYISMKVGAFVTTETIATNSFVKCSSASEDIGHFVNFQPDAKECRIGSFDSAYVPAPGEESILVALTSLSWNTWGPWSTCSATCLGGTRFRNRTCQNPICPQALAQEINVCNDLGCSAYPDYVIKEDGNQYRFSDTQATWSEARDACEATPGSRLAVPKSSAEFHAIFSFQHESSTWIGLTSPYNQTHSPSSNVTGRLFDYHDNSTFIHDSAIMGGINVNANGLCVFMKSNSETNFAGTKSCENEYTYLCQIRIV